MSKSYYLHGCKSEKLYEVWCSMKARCNSKKSQFYSHYGGRGIKVCDEWQHEYINFRTWAYKNGYKEGLWIDRINVNGNYEPSNCRWATITEQQNNKRDTVWITYNDKTLSLHEWAKNLNINPSTLYYRYVVNGWNAERALFEKVSLNKHSRKINIKALEVI